MIATNRAPQLTGAEYASICQRLGETIAKARTVAEACESCGTLAMTIGKDMAWVSDTFNSLQYIRKHIAEGEHKLLPRRIKERDAAASALQQAEARHARELEALRKRHAQEKAQFEQAADDAKGAVWRAEIAHRKITEAQADSVLKHALK